MMSASEPGRRRILLVEPYPAVSRGLTSWLTRQAQLEVIGVAATRDECLQWLHRPHPDLIIMEPAIRDCDGLKLVWLFSKFHHQTPILVFSVLDEKEYAPRLFRSGACEFLPKSASPEKLLSTVKTVLSGQARSDPVASGNARTFSEAPRDLLSDRELELFRFLGKGYTTQHIAEVMHLSEYTVHAYRLRIKRKLRLGDLSHLMQQAVLWENHLS